jgi:hypothetical protein
MMPEIEHYTVTATIQFTIDGPLTMGEATEEASIRLAPAKRLDRPVTAVTVTDIHIHREK